MNISNRKDNLPDTTAMGKTISNKTIARDGELLSPWQTQIRTASILTGAAPDVTYDCLVVGGGITGLTAALLLQQAGSQVVIAEAHTIGFGTTSGTSAHINTFADTTFQGAENDFGEEGARLFADSIAEGFNLIRDNIASFQIDCDFEEKPGYLYAESKDEASQLDEIYKGAIKVGVAVQYTETAPTRVPFQKALFWPGQAQFNPLKYLKGLQAAFSRAGGVILENKPITGIESRDGIHTAKGIRAKEVIYATHLPPNINLFNFECAPYRSYVMAVKLKGGTYPDALIYDSQEPYP